MDNFEDALFKLNELLTDVESAVISNPTSKSAQVKKIKAERVTVKNRPVYRFERIIDNKAYHENTEKSELYKKLLSVMCDEGYKQCDIRGNVFMTVLMNKNKQFKLTGIKENTNFNLYAQEGHNKQKKYILNDKAVPWMTALGLMDENGIVISSKQKKFRQINRFLEMLADIEKHLPNNCTVIDMGCGKSYLTFAMYHYFNCIKNKNVRIMGFDLKKDVVEHCNTLSRKFGFDKLEFYNKDIADIDNVDGKIGMIITLHACDTATDIALYHGIRWGCNVIMSVPCCQHELFGQIKNDSLSVITDHGILKERFAALLTDGIRAKILEIMGYKTGVMEFIDMEHTPKNIMIRAVKNQNAKQDNAKREELEKMLADFNVKQCLYEMCFG